MNRDQLVSTIEIRDKEGRVIGSRDVVRYAALLNRAHDEGLKSIKTKLVQVPAETNNLVAVATAEVETEKGIFSGTADASPANTTSRMERYLIALAETRAKARALRDAVNIGVVSLEEIVGENGDGDYLSSKREPKEPPRRGKGPFPQKGTNDRGNGNGMSEAQRRYLFRLLAGQGIKDEAAHGYLREHVGTDSLASITRQQASSLIEELLKEKSA